MNRDPDIFIKASKLRLFILENLKLSDSETESLLDALLEFSSQNVPTNRLNVKTSVSKKVKKSEDITSEEVDYFYGIFYQKRIENRHRNVPQSLKPTDSDYPYLIDAIKDAKNITSAYFEGNIEKGFYFYIEQALKILKTSLTLRKMVLNKEKISIAAQTHGYVLSYPNKELVNNIYLHYVSKINKLKKVNLELEDFETYVHFCYTADEVIRRKVDYKMWIDAQFKKLEFCNSFPHPRALYGDTAWLTFTQYNR